MVVEHEFLANGFGVGRTVGGSHRATLLHKGSESRYQVNRGGPRVFTSVGVIVLSDCVIAATSCRLFGCEMGKRLAPAQTVICQLPPPLAQMRVVHSASLAWLGASRRAHAAMRCRNVTAEPREQRVLAMLTTTRAVVACEPHHAAGPVRDRRRLIGHFSSFTRGPSTLRRLNLSSLPESD
jgi:hypothetical protein